MANENNSQPLKKGKKHLIITISCLLALAGLIHFGASYVTKFFSGQTNKMQETKYWKFVSQVPVDLINHYNNDGIAQEDDITDTNIDTPEVIEGLPGGGFPSEQLPAAGSIIHIAKLDTRFLFPSSNPRQLNNVSCLGQRLRVDHLMPGEVTCNEVNILAAAVNGDSKPVDATFILEYNDGRNDKVAVKVPAWDTDQPGNVEVAAKAPFRYVWSASDRKVVKIEKPAQIYCITLGANNGRKLTGVILPAEPGVRVFAVTLKLDTTVTNPEVAVRGDAAAIAYKRAADTGKEPSIIGEKMQAASEKLAGLTPSPQLARQFAWLDTEKKYVNETLGDKLVLRKSADEENLAAVIASIESGVNELAAAKDPFKTKKGNVIKSYVSPIDGQPQPYSLFIPDTYEPGEKIPLVVALHSYRGNKLFQGTPSPLIPRNAIVLSPHGRGSIDYVFIAEEDVLACIDEVMKDYSIDPARVYLVGSAMGGTGVWSLATKYPHRFAAVAPRSADGDSAASKILCPNQTADRDTYAAIRHFVAASLDPATYGMNLFNVPAYFTHGSEDAVVPVESSRTMARNMEAAGVKYVYNEGKDGGHNWMPARYERESFEFLFSKTLEEAPAKITHRAAYLKYGQAYWIRIAQFDRPVEYGELSAETTGSEVVIKVKNVSAIEIDLNKCPAGRKPTVKINDVVAFDGAPSGDKLLLYKQGTVWAAVDKFPELMKKPYVEGPVSDIFTAPFIIVVGTQGPDADKKVISEEAKRFVAQWSATYGAPCRIAEDKQITGKDMAAYNLVLYGGPKHNIISKRIADRLPISIGEGSITIADRIYTGKNLAAKFCYPNPLNPDKMIAMIAPAGSVESIFQSNNMFGNWLRWAGHDGRSWFDYIIYDSKTYNIESSLEAGIFGNMWQIDSRSTWIGRDVDRASFRDRKFPALATAAAAPAEAEEVFLSDVMPVEFTQPKHTIGFDSNSRGWQITMGSPAEPVEKGIGIRPPTSIKYLLQADGQPERFTFFRAKIGIDMDGETVASTWREKCEWMKFLVYGDGKLLYQSPLVTWASKPIDIEVPIAGVKALELKVVCSKSRWLVGSAAWANAKVTNK